MNISTSELTAQVKHLKEHGQISLIEASLKDARAHPAVTVSLGVAIGSRETNCTNIVGDFGHGRGMFQVDDRSWAPWLKAHAGCRSGSFVPDGKATALDAGHCPTVGSGAVKMALILTEGIVYAKQHGVPDGQRVHFAVSAYNAGLGGAMFGFQHGDSDRQTTGHDYADDVLERMHALAHII